MLLDDVSVVQNADQFRVWILLSYQLRKSPKFSLFPRQSSKGPTIPTLQLEQHINKVAMVKRKVAALEKIDADLYVNRDSIFTFYTTEANTL